MWTYLCTGDVFLGICVALNSLNQCTVSSKEHIPQDNRTLSWTVS